MDDGVARRPRRSRVPAVPAIERESGGACVPEHRRRSGLPDVSQAPTRRPAGARPRRARRAAGRAAVLLVGADDRARRGDQPGRWPRGERGRQVLDAAALRADARQQEDRLGQQLAGARQVARRGRAQRRRRRRSGRTRRRARRRAARRARPRAPRPSRRRPAPRPPGRPHPGWTCARARTAPRRAGGPRRRTSATCRGPCSGATVIASAPRPGSSAPSATGVDADEALARRRWPRRRCRRAWRRPGRAGRRRGRGARSSRERLPAGSAEPLEARDLRLDGDGRRGRRRRSRRGSARRRPRRRAAGRHARGLEPQPPRVGVEAEHDLRLALGDERPPAGRRNGRPGRAALSP